MEVPDKGFWYDVGAFWMIFDNRTESLNVDANGNPSNTDFVIQNSGTSRHRGFEGELSYDFLAPFQNPPVPVTESKDYSAKNVVDSKVQKIPLVPGVSLADCHPLRLISFQQCSIS